MFSNSLRAPVRNCVLAQESRLGDYVEEGPMVLIVQIIAGKLQLGRKILSATHAGFHYRDCTAERVHRLVG